jgi:Cu-Zn family superoxide dismutase
LGLNAQDVAASRAGNIERVTKAICILYPTKGNTAEGKVIFTMKDGEVVITGEITGLAPGEHAFHVHEFGDCSAPDAMSAGGHFNPTKMPHGGPHAEKRHVGDLGNITADENGKVVLDVHDKVIHLSGPMSIVGYSLIVHAAPDDLKSQPSGNAGARVACGIIDVANPSADVSPAGAESSHLRIAKQLILKLSTGAANLSREERESMQKTLRLEARELSFQEKKKLQEYQEQLVSERAGKRGDRMEKIRMRINKFFELPETKRNSYLDAEIDKIEKARKEGDESKADSMFPRLGKLKEGASDEDKGLIEKMEKALNDRMKERGLKPLQ